MKKPQIPAIPHGDPGLSSVLRAIKENIEVTSGVRGGKVAPLSSSATNAEIIAKINEIIDRISA